MRIGILGATGPAGSGLAARLADGGHEVLFGSRAVDKAQAARRRAEREVGRPGRRACIPCDNAWACDAPVVILAVHADSAIPTVQEHAERLQGKIVVSMANNLVKHGNEFNAVLPPHGSVAAEIQALLWRSRVCTAFHLVPAAEFADARPRRWRATWSCSATRTTPRRRVMEITREHPEPASARRRLAAQRGRHGDVRGGAADGQHPAQDARQPAAHDGLTRARAHRSLRPCRHRHRCVARDRQGRSRSGSAGWARRSCARRAASEDAPGGIAGHDPRHRRRDQTPAAPRSRSGATSATRTTSRTSSTRRSTAFGGLDVLVNNAMAPTQALVRRVDRRAVGRVDARQRAQPLPLRPGRRAADGRSAAAAASSTSRRTRADHATHAVHAARLPHLRRRQGRARAVHERARARGAPLGIAVNALRPGAVQDREDRAGVRRGPRLERLDDTRRSWSRRSRRSLRRRAPTSPAASSTSAASARPGRIRPRSSLRP